MVYDLGYVVRKGIVIFRFLEDKVREFKMVGFGLVRSGEGLERLVF